MKVIDVGAPLITLRDKNGNEIKMLICSYDTYGDDEIVIKSTIRETDLYRGWTGDMICYVPDGKDYLTGDVMDGTSISEIHRNILLKSVRIDSVEMQEATIWKYTFLKD